MARGSWVWTSLLVVAVVAARLPHLRAAAGPDEAGYLLVAAAAHPGGAYLYGDLWVDRPPLLIAFYRVAEASGGLLALRLLALAPIVLLVVSAAGAGALVSGARGATWASTAAAALVATPLLGTQEIDGELLAAPFVMCSCALGLSALARHERSRSCGSRLPPWSVMAAAGATGSTALLIKQNFVDSFVFLVAMLLACAVRGSLSVRTGLALLAALVGGAAVPVSAALVWARAWGAGPGELWRALFGFRVTSLRVIASQSAAAPTHRAVTLAWAAAHSGLVPVLVVFLVASAARLRRLEPVAASVAAMTAAAVPAIGLGGSYWTHYLIELVPAASLALSATARGGGLARASSVGALALVTASAVVAVLPTEQRAVDGAGGAASCSVSSGAAVVSRWLQQHANRGDTVVPVYGVADTLLGSGLRVSYPYLWSLPVRTLDPQLTVLRGALRGPHAATWVVRSLPVLLRTGLTCPPTLVGDRRAPGGAGEGQRPGAVPDLPPASAGSACGPGRSGPHRRPPTAP